MKLTEFPNWQPLLINKHLNIDVFNKLCGNGKNPGIYLLAYSSKNLTNKKIVPDDIYYVGMSNAQGGVLSRIKQFIKGISTGYGHSGGNRFFKTVTNELGFKNMHTTKKFCISILSTECEVRKHLRTPEHLRLMGNVVRDEYYILAEIKEKINEEPKLNFK